MKKILIIATLAFTACTQNQQSANDADTTVHENALEYNYEPTVSTLNGTLTSKIYFGPPGYGEDTLADEKERVYVLVLDKGINMKKPAKDVSDGYNAAINNIMKIQILSQENLDNYLNKTVSVTGTLFGAQTGHHHTDVLLDLKTIDDQE